MSTVLQKKPTLRSAVFRIVVASGESAGRALAVDRAAPGRLFVGSSQAVALRLDDPHVSRRHAAFEIRNERLVVQDLQSTNGTFVNGVQVTEALLAGGETLRLGRTELRVELEGAKATVSVSPETSFGRVVGQSAEMRRLYPLCARLAESDVPIILEGETGTGKEAMAEAIHEASPRAQGPFVVFDCTTVPATLVESSLFGHERGAFTGATTARAGVFEQAHGGTLLIDEIGDLDVALQPKLLRALERSSVQRVGGSSWIDVDVRIIAATRRDLESEIQAGRFRDDLYYRLAVARIELPPLRERKGDIRLLAERFWADLGGAGLPPSAFLDSLERYAWPGNVRELHNAVAHRVALGELADIGTLRRERGKPAADDGGEPGRDMVARVIADRMPFVRARKAVMDDFEERYLAWVLAEHGGNVSKAAEASGIARRYFYVLRSKKGAR